MSLTLWRKRDPDNGGLSRLRQDMDQMFNNFMIEPFESGAPRHLRNEQ